MLYFKSQFRQIWLLSVVVSLAIAASSVNAADDSSSRLSTLASKGRLTQQAIEAFYSHAEQQAMQSARLSEEFWDWVRSNRTIYHGLLAVLHPDYNTDIVHCLSELYAAYGSKLDDYPHMAMAFAIVYGQASGETIRAPWMDWVAKGRDVPSMKDSFKYYLDYESKMLFPLKTTPWPLLVHVADNDVPIAERKWALLQHAGKSLESLSKVHGEPKYIKGAFALRVVRISDVPMTLSRISRQGGVCSQQAYYASSIFKTLAIPSVRLTTPGHAYEGWVELGESYSVRYLASRGVYDGEYFCPIKRQKAGQHEFALTASAMDLSYEGYLKAIVGCHLYNAMPEKDRTKAISLLYDAVDENPYYARAWLCLADIDTTGVSLNAEAERIIRKALATLDSHPVLLCDIAERVFSSRVEVVAASAGNEYNRDISLLNSVIKRFENTERVDLLARIRNVMGSYVFRRNGFNATAEIYSGWLKSTEDDSSYKQQLVHLIKLADGSGKNESLHTLLKQQWSDLPVFHDNEAAKNMSVSKRHELVFSSLYSSYQKAGLKQKAADLQLAEDRKLQNAMRTSDSTMAARTGVVGAIGRDVTGIEKKGACCYVWRILPEYLTASRYRVSVKHAAVGDLGAFSITAWLDSNNDGVPDTELATSPLFKGKPNDLWSSWEFSTKSKSVFVGIVLSPPKHYFYQMGGVLEGYVGLSDRVFYTRQPDKPPINSTRPRYTNIRIKPVVDY